MNQEDHVDACLALDSYRNLFHFKFVRCKYKRSAAKCSIWRSNCDSRRHDIVSHGPAQPCWAQLSDLEALGFEILSRTPNLRTVRKGCSEVSVPLCGNNPLLWVFFPSLFVPGQHKRFDGSRSAETILTQLLHRLGKIKVSPQRRLQENGKRTRNFDMPSSGL